MMLTDGVVRTEPADGGATREYRENNNWILDAVGADQTHHVAFAHTVLPQCGRQPNHVFG